MWDRLVEVRSSTQQQLCVFHHPLHLNNVHRHLQFSAFKFVQGTKRSNRGRDLLKSGILYFKSPPVVFLLLSNGKVKERIHSSPVFSLETARPRCRDQPRISHSGGLRVMIKRWSRNDGGPPVAESLNTSDSQRPKHCIVLSFPTDFK